MRLRIASINDLPIRESDRKYHWPLRPPSQRSPFAERAWAVGGQRRLIASDGDVPRSRTWSVLMKAG